MTLGKNKNYNVYNIYNISSTPFNFEYVQKCLNFVSNDQISFFKENFFYFFFLSNELFVTFLSISPVRVAVSLLELPIIEQVVRMIHPHNIETRKKKKEEKILLFLLFLELSGDTSRSISFTQQHNSTSSHL